MKSKTFIALFIFALLHINCTNKAYYKEVKQLHSETWNYQEPQRFEYTINDTTATYNVLLFVKHNKKYPYANLWLKVQTKFPKGKLHTDTINFPLADQKLIWIGKKGKNYELYYLYKKNIKFDQAGSFSTDIFQIMRQDNLPGIEQIGIVIEKL